MNSGYLISIIASGVIAVLLPMQPAIALTEFNCTINAVDSHGKTVPVSAVNCSAMVSYVNNSTEESQNLLRYCKVNNKKKNSCSSTFDDSDITISIPDGAGISSVNAVEATASSLVRRGCVRTNLIRNTIINKTYMSVDITHEITCP